jgi:hypothetical protein
VKGFARLRGEFGPLYLARNFDEEGNPLGYRPMTGLELLYNLGQQSAFQRLPDRFAFKEAKAIYERADEATKGFLQKCIRVGILRKPAKGLYEKVGIGGASGAARGRNLFLFCYIRPKFVSHISWWADAMIFGRASAQMSRETQGPQQVADSMDHLSNSHWV